MSVTEANEQNIAELFGNVCENKLAVFFFWANFHEPSKSGGQMDRVFSLLSRSFPDVQFAKIDAENHEEYAQKYQVHVIPTFLFVTRKGSSSSEIEVLDRVTGANPRDLKQKLKQLSERLTDRGSVSTNSNPIDQLGIVTNALKSISSIINASHVVLIMDGTPQHPGSNESREVLTILQDNKFKFGHYDIGLDSDGVVTKALTVLSAALSTNSTTNPTSQLVPLLFIGGKCLGGHKNILALNESQELLKMKPVELPSPEKNLNAYLKQLISRDKIMLFMKGNPQDAKCRFSRQMCELLAEHGITNFGSFNILSDESVRQGLKTFSNWPTFPQLYVNGKLIGGIDIVRELAEDEGDLREALGLPPAQSLDDRIRSVVNSAPVLLVMKGSIEEPFCKFSRRAVALLKENNISFSHFDILLDEEVRQGIKKFSNWPTFPQLYVKGKLIGGVDIIQELHDDEELKDLI